VGHAGWRRLLPLGVCDLPQGLLRSWTHRIRSMRRIDASSKWYNLQLDHDQSSGEFTRARVTGLLRV